MKWCFPNPLGQARASAFEIVIGAVPAASATHSCVRPSFPRDTRMGRKSRLLAHSLPSLDSRVAGLEVEITESLRPRPRIFPFCGDYRRRLVRSLLPPEDGSVGLSPTGRDGCWSVGTTCVQADVPLSRGDKRGREGGQS